MRAGIACLIIGYLFSQFFRSFLAVLTPVLELELGAGKQDLASASGWWFLAFGATQLPVGVALDRIGPRRTTAALLALAAVGAAGFAMAQEPLHIKLAMVLIGAGCAPVLVATYFILAREFPPVLFGTLASVTIGLGSLGDMAASLPFSLAAETWGWRASLMTVAGMTLVMALAVLAIVRDPAPVDRSAGGSVLSVLAIRPLWPVLALMVVCYAPPAALRGLWLGPYFHDVHGFGQAQIGKVGLAMGLALVAGSLIIGPLSRWLRSLKRTAALGNALMLACLLGLWLIPAPGWLLPAALFAGVGLFGTTFPIITAHARGFIPAHLMGRGVTLVNLFGIASVGVAQEVTGRLFDAGQRAGLSPGQGYSLVFACFALMVLAGLALYTFSRESPA